MTFASYQQWSNMIHLKFIGPDFIEETDINRADGSVTHQSRRPYLADSTPEIYAECYAEVGYKQIADLSEYEAEIRAIEGQEQLVAEHIEEIERGTAA